MAVQNHSPVWVAGVLLAVTSIPTVLIGAPIYRVWNAQQSGKAALAQAEQEKQIQIEQARAEVESAKLRAEAIEIIGKKLKEFPEYRDQEFIANFGEAMVSGKIQQIVYVPTEANVPIVRVIE